MNVKVYNIQPNKDPIDSGKDSVTGIAEPLWPPVSRAAAPGGTTPAAEAGALLTTALLLFEAVVVGAALGGNWPAVVWGGGRPP